MKDSFYIDVTILNDRYEINWLRLFQQARQLDTVSRIHSKQFTRKSAFRTNWPLNLVVIQGAENRTLWSYKFTFRKCGVIIRPHIFCRLKGTTARQVYASYAYMF